MKTYLLAGLFAASCLVSGCATNKPGGGTSTDFPKQALKKGNVEIGFTSDMVRVAMGKPDRKYIRKTASGDVVVWSYVGHDTRPEKQKVTGRFNYRDSDRRLRTATDTVVMDVNRYIEYDKVRVEMLNNQVIAIEEIDEKPVFF